MHYNENKLNRTVVKTGCNHAHYGPDDKSYSVTFVLREIVIVDWLRSHDGYNGLINEALRQKMQQEDSGQ